MKIVFPSRRGENSILYVKKTNAAEVNELLSVYIEKVKWLRAADKPLWDKTQFTIEELNRMYNNPVFYVGIVNNTVVSGFILIENDLLYWLEKMMQRIIFINLLLQTHTAEKAILTR